MPIYAYRCDACGFAKDVLQKISDPLLTICPSCGKSDFKKQVTAAGFQLKGTGWYATDFKGGSGGVSAAATDAQKKDANDANSSGGGSTASDAKAASASSDSTTPAPSTTKSE